jgi:hypothetical protein
VAVITKELAQGIARKLKAVIQSKKGSAHDLACVYYKGRLVAQFGIRRGSKKNLGHDHIPAAIHLAKRQAKLLGQCPMSEDDWLEVMREKELLGDESDPSN